MLIPEKRKVPTNQTPEAREAMSKAAKKRHAKDRATKLELVVPPSLEQRLQALIDRFEIKTDIDSLKEAAEVYVGSLSNSFAYALYMFALAETKKGLKDMLENRALNDNAKVKVYALLHDLNKDQLSVAKDLGLLDQEHPERKLQKLVDVVVRNTPPEFQAAILEKVRKELAVVA